MNSMSGELLYFAVHDFSWDVHRLIERAFENPVVAPPSEDADAKTVARIICSTSIVHQSDQILRKLVAEKMTMAKGRMQCGASRKRVPPFRPFISM